MPSKAEWTAEQAVDAARTTLAMARAAEHEDAPTVAVLWNAARNRPCLIWMLARLPGIFGREIIANIEMEPWLQAAMLEAAGLDDDVQPEGED